MSLLRVSVLLLVFANLLCFAVGMEYIHWPRQPGESERLAKQLNPEALRIVAIDEAPPVAPEPDVCRELQGLSAEEAQTLAATYKENGAKVTVRPIQETASFWVFMPPAADKAGAEKKQAELIGLGVTDMVMVEDGPNKWAISLGLFSSEQRATEHLANLRKLGVRTARIDKRQASAKIIFEVQGSPTLLDRLFAKLPQVNASVMPTECVVAEKSK